MFCTELQRSSTGSSWGAPDEDHVVAGYGSTVREGLLVPEVAK